MLHPHGLFWLHPILVCVIIAALALALLNFGNVKRIVVGKPIRSRELHGSKLKLTWWIALPVLAADLYSSVAYGPEAGITELAPLGNDVKWMIIPITASTVLLLMILITSYIMGVIAYPNGGGAYAISKDNFQRPWVSLVAASALMVDYVLTVAVSVSSGVQTMASSYPVLAGHETELSILCVIVILFVNLRGVSESSKVFAYPTFVFMGCMLFLIGAGFDDEVHHGFVQPVTPPFGTIPEGLTLMLLLKAFSSACSALTGVETISNAVPIFRDGKNGAIKAYIALGVITGITLLGFAYHLYVRGISVNPNNTMLSQLAGDYFGHGIVYQVIIISTFVVLILAANSTFTGFPQLAALVASDRFLPRALTLRGDRLGYSNGMIVLAALASLLIEVFHAQTNALIPLYAIGVFVAFTVAQLGLFKRWIRVKGSMWRTKAVINGFGAFITGLVAVVFAVTKFTSGAWIVLVILPVVIFIAMKIRQHYIEVADELRIDLKTVHPEKHRIVSVVLISGIHRLVVDTISFAMSSTPDVIALYIGFDDESIERMEQKWEAWGAPCRLVTIKSEYRSLLYPLSKFIRRLETYEGGKPDHIQLLIAQFVPKKWWHNLLHNQTSLLIRAWMLRHKDVVVSTVPYHLRK
ncbi:amino acid/polyamine/organocation transporter (APC superfamily) [Alicyclobacillus sacchari]|uniref:Amino acid/polyamine/organocation transporter (APC superfamily) n=1 Tax=Alicyclobacillus sacchari TaxID=392010 RepID=A0A4R8LV44_9BACL|nr:APC family permease [Alicyclobacillus sacchari]TDY50637.1 amino acid/polyamine/organocation transporter (APC superfamily) [Alicyclobacillus sacchari]